MEHEDEQVRYYGKVALVRSGGIDPTDLQLSTLPDRCEFVSHPVLLG